MVARFPNPFRRAPQIQRRVNPVRKHAKVLGYEISYLEGGSGPPVLFLHGGVGGAHTWRRSMAHLAPHARCVAVDLIGTGESDRLSARTSDAYGLVDQLAYLEAFIKVLDLEDGLTVVLHGWGSMIGFRWAFQHRASLRAICHLESVVRPLTWADLPEPARHIMEQARSDQAEEFVLFTDSYLSAALKSEVLNPLDRGARDEYRAMFGTQPESRRAYLRGLQEVPIDGDPPGSHALVTEYSNWLCEDPVPKLLIQGEPGYLMRGEYLSWAERLPNQRLLPVTGSHLLPEDSPDGVGAFLTRWFLSDVAGTQPR